MLMLPRLPPPLDVLVSTLEVIPGMVLAFLVNSSDSQFNSIGVATARISATSIGGAFLLRFIRLDRTPIKQLRLSLFVAVLLLL